MMDGEELGRTAVEVGAGRRRVGETIDHAAGVEMAVRIGDAVDKGQTIARILVGERPVDELKLANARKLTLKTAKR